MSDAIEPSKPAVVYPLDTVADGFACPKCGCTLWIVDGDGKGKFWLLCMAVENDPECVETREIPPTHTVSPWERKK